MVETRRISRPTVGNVSEGGRFRPIGALRSDSLPKAPLSIATRLADNDSGIRFHRR
jgi:hypothetical protein